MSKRNLRRAFAPYLTEVQHLTEVALDANVRMQDIPGYVDNGTDSVVCRLPSNPRFVAKLPVMEGSGIRPRKAVSEYVGPLILGMGVSGLEQIVAYRKARPSAVLCRFIPGQALDKVAEVDARRIPTAHFAGLLTTFRAMQERGLATDVGGGNLVYNIETGFTVIDYKKSREQTLAQKVLEFASPETLLMDILDDVEVPPHALRFRDICASELGPGVAADMNRMWEEYHLIVPA